MISNEDVLKEVSDEFIEDIFVMNGQEIYVLNNSLFNGTVEEDALILCKGEEKNGECVLAKLTEEEYMAAHQRYYELVELFRGDCDE